MTDKSRKEAPTFEQAMEELELIVDELESGDLTLDKSLERYERGVKAVRRCRQILDEAEKKLKVLLKDEGGEFHEDEVEEEESQ